MKAYERRAAKRNRPLLRDVRSEMPDAETMVLALVKNHGDGEEYLTSAYDSGSCWRSGVSGRAFLGGRVVGWIHMHEAVRILKAATAGGAR